jgi:rod shape-determining protein MreC
MKANRHQRNPVREGLVLAVTVGLSLALLFFSKHSGVERIRGELADAMKFIVLPFSQLGSIVNMWQDYEDMRTYAMELSLENRMLRDAVLENERLRAMLEFKNRSSLDLIPASVVARVGSGVGGRLRLNAGREDGVTLNSAVITPRGLVGKIIETSDRTSLVQTLVGNSYGVSVIIERTRLTGILRWRAQGEWVVLGLPTGADVRRRDVIITSGAGSVFPKGIRAGIVSGSSPIDSPVGQSWLVEPLVDFGTLEEIFVVAPQQETDSTEILEAVQSEELP